MSETEDQLRTAVREVVNSRKQGSYKAKSLHESVGDGRLQITVHQIGEGDEALEVEFECVNVEPDRVESRVETLSDIVMSASGSDIAPGWEHTESGYLIRYAIPPEIREEWA